MTKHFDEKLHTFPSHYVFFSMKFFVTGDDFKALISLCVQCISNKCDTHGARQDVVGTWIQQVTFADSFICKFNSLSHGITLKWKPEDMHILEAFCMIYLFNYRYYSHYLQMGWTSHISHNRLFQQNKWYHNRRNEISNCLKETMWHSKVFITYM